MMEHAYLRHLTDSGSKGDEHRLEESYEWMNPVYQQMIDEDVLVPSSTKDALSSILSMLYVLKKTATEWSPIPIPFAVSVLRITATSIPRLNVESTI
jgi:hypothetical protein